VSMGVRSWWGPGVRCPWRSVAGERDRAGRRFVAAVSRSSFRSRRQRAHAHRLHALCVVSGTDDLGRRVEATHDPVRAHARCHRHSRSME
jgi:hypothetical protein